MQRMLSYIRKAVDDYNMINDEDKIAVGLSGGKDSITLLMGLKALQRFYNKKRIKLPRYLFFIRNNYQHSP